MMAMPLGWSLEPAASEMDELLREIDCCTQLGISPSAFAGPALVEAMAPDWVSTALVAVLSQHLHAHAQAGRFDGLLLSDVGSLLPPELRAQVKQAGGLRSCLLRPAAMGVFELSGRPGRETVQLRALLPGKDHASHASHSSSSSTVASPRSWFPDHPKETRVVKLRGLPFGATEEEVGAFVGDLLAARCPSLRGKEWRVQLLRNRDGRPSGFAHIHFTDESDVEPGQRALHLSTFGDRYIEAFVRKCPTERAAPTPQEEQAVVLELATLLAQREGCCLLSQLGAALSAASRDALRPCGLKNLVEASPVFVVEGQRGAEVVRLSAALEQTRVDAFAQSMTAHMTPAGVAEEGCVRRLRLRGLPFSAVEQDVLEFVVREGQAAWLEGPEPVKVQRRNNGRPTGIALVHLKPGLALSTVVQALDGKNMGDRYIEVFAADDK